MYIALQFCVANLQQACHQLPHPSHTNQLIDPSQLDKLPEDVQELLARADKRRLLHGMFNGLLEIHSRNLGAKVQSAIAFDGYQRTATSSRTTSSSRRS